jgi:hypothetical protein
MPVESSSRMLAAANYALRTMQESRLELGPLSGGMSKRERSPLKIKELDL